MEPTAMRIMASKIPKGIHRMINREVVAVGRFTSRPSWKITGCGRSKSELYFVVAINGGCFCSCMEMI